MHYPPVYSLHLPAVGYALIIFSLTLTWSLCQQVMSGRLSREEGVDGSPHRDSSHQVPDTGR